MRRRAGADRRDEVWQGVRHLSPDPSRAHLDLQQQLAELLGPRAREAGLVPGVGGFNLGTKDDYRVPDGGLFRDRGVAVWNPTAALVLEIVSPGDETWDKLGFYAAHDVAELLIVDPHARVVQWFSLADREYEPTDRSALVELGPEELAARIDWPELDD
jgi:Uma2 family endonuclease